MEVKNGLITFYGFYPSLYLCSPLKKERPKHATRGNFNTAACRIMKWAQCGMSYSVEMWNIRRDVARRVCTGGDSTICVSA